MGFWGGLKDFFVGGNATEGLNTQGANSQYAQDFLRNQLGSAGGRQAPMAQAAQLGQAAQLNGGPQDHVRQQQQQAAGFLQGIMGGQQAGAGELAVNRQVGNALAQQTAMARGRGPNAALMARNAARNQADIGLAGAGQAAQAQMQDQQGAVGQLGQMLGGMRGQDLDLAGQNAQLQQQRMLQQGQFGQQAALANQQAQLAQTGMNDQAQQGYMQQLLGMDAQTFQNEMAKRGLAAQDKGALPGLIQAGASIGAAAAASDRNLKTDIRDARADVDAMMDALQPFAYRYRDERHGAGERVGIMTQDLERSEMGREMVVDMPDGEGKGFDIVKGISAALAGIARLNERLSQIEERLG